MNIFKLLMACAILFPASAMAQNQAQIGSHNHHNHHGHHNHKVESSHDHASHDLVPIGVMGAHMHNKGEWMLSYRYMHMDMEGNRDGTNRLSADEIVTTVPNRFFGNPMQTATLRVVPTEMTMDMHMISGMYGVTDWFTGMVMLNYIEKEMDHITYQGGAGTNELGRFSTKSSGWGDTRLGGLLRLLENKGHNMHMGLSLSLPTGSTDETAQVLTPMNARPILRMPYAMQLGTGTYDLHPSLSYIGYQGNWGWGAQANAEIRLENENDEGYAWGDKYELTAWGAYRFAPWFSTSLRLSALTQDSIDGIDPNIAVPVQTADPDNYGGEIVNIGLGVNLNGTKGYLKGHRLGFEAMAPLYRDLNGPQMETDWTVTFAWRKSF